MDFMRAKNVMLRRTVVLIITILMIITSLPLSAFADSDFNYDNIPGQKEKFLNKEPVKYPAVFENDPNTKDEANAQIKNFNMPKLHNIKVEYKAKRDDKSVHLFNPYEATAGDDEYTYKDYKGKTLKVMTDEDKGKINKEVKLPEIDGYTAPTQKTDINYNFIKTKAKEGTQSANKFSETHPYIYEPKEAEIRVKHIFQSVKDKNKYGLKDGEEKYTYTTFKGKVGSEITIPPLSKEKIKGYTPEKTVIKTRVPERIPDDGNLDKDYNVIQYRYNRDSYYVSYNMDGGTPIPSQTLYYGQTIPNLNANPKKIGAIFDGWKSDTDLKYKDADGNIKTLRKDTKFDMKDFKDGIKDAMPAHNVVFTAVWRDKPKANYTIQFWTEKADSDGYDYIGAKVVKNADTGTRPDLSRMMPSGIKFPEIEESVTEDGKLNELNKYYVRNEKKITKENTEDVKLGDGTNLKMTKKVQPDDKTTYNIYYDRQKYTMLFEKFGIDNPEWGYPAKEAKMVLPDGTKYDSTKEVNKPYSFVAKFGERMTKWPNDMWLIEEGGIDFDPNRSFIGWQLNSENNNNEDQSLYLDTPPYWLTSKDFIDREYGALDPDVTPATHSTSTGELLPERTISLGPSSSEQYQFAIYYMEYLFEGFDGAYHYNPDMSYTKIDTSGSYTYPSPYIAGFKPKYEGIDPVNDAKERPAKRIGHTEDLSKVTFDELGNKLDKSEENRKSSEKSLFDPIAQNGINGVPFKDIPKYRFAFTYEREEHKIFLDTDPSDINEHSDFTGKKLASGKDATITEVKYDIPLRKLNLDEEYKLTEADRPANVPEDFVFKGWSIDPQGSKMIKDTVKEAEKLETQIANKFTELANNSKDKEKKFKIQNEIKELKAKLADADANMPNYDIVLYAKWGEPDRNYKIKFDPNEGTLPNIDPSDIATSKDGEIIETSEGKVKYTMPEKLPDEEGGVQVFNVKSRMNIKFPPEPKRKGYDFLGWELIRYNEDGSIDKTYMDKYSVPELYAFGNEVVKDSYLKAIWVKNELVDIPAVHYFLDENFDEKVDKRENTTVYNRRVGEYAGAAAIYQGEDNLLIPQAEWKKLAKKSNEYKEYNDQTKRENIYFQNFIVEPEKIDNNGNLEDNPKAKNNIFKFFYREFMKKHYKVNYLSTAEKDAAKLPAIGEMPDGSFKIIETEEVTSGCTDYDAVNYREIPGWKIISTPQRQLFYSVNEDGEMTGINGVESDEVNFYYQDVRVIKRKTTEAKTPDGYHRVVFKADINGSFGKDSDGNVIKEVVYDVIDGLKFKNIKVPPEQNDEGTIESPVITPDQSAEFIGWEDSKLLDNETVIGQDYTFTAKFKKVIDAGIITPVPEVDPADITVSESFKDGDEWINNFIPSEESIINGIKIKNKDGVLEGIPEGAKLEFGYGDIDSWNKYDNLEQPLYEMLKEKDDGANPNRKEIIKAKVTIDGMSRIVEIPIKVNKNIYEVKNLDNKPDYVPDGYVKVEVDPTLDAREPQKKFYYVNPKAFVRIPGKDPLPAKDKVFAGWVLRAGSNDEVPYSLPDRYKFTENENLIKAVFVPNVVGQKDKDKPIVPDYFVMVTVDSKEYAKDPNKKIYYVNPNVEVGLPIDNPEGIEHWNFLNWKVDNDPFNTKVNHKFVKDTIIYANWNMDPSIEVKDITITKGDNLDLKTLIVKAHDLEDGNLIDKVEIVSKGGFNKNKIGKYEIVFRVTDRNGAVAEAKALVTVVSKPAKPDGDKNSPTTGDNTSNGYVYLGTLGIVLLLAMLGKRRKKGGFY